jgi:hypothetical protein
MADEPDANPEPEAVVRYDENGLPLRRFMIPGGPMPRDMPRVRIPRRATIERGGPKDFNR